MKERPILFSGPMVRAILDGRKNVTRRVLAAPGQGWEFGLNEAGISLGTINSPHPKRGKFGVFVRRELSKGSGKYERDVVACPYGQPGDRLWVRESHAQVFEVDIPEGRPAGPIGTAGSPAYPDWKSRYVYRADGIMPNVQWHHVGDSQPVRWTPSIHMPRAACRLLLEITAVRVERLQDISAEHAMAEGVLSCESELDPNGNGYSPYELFSALWVSINGPDSWHANPWVWVVEFKRVEAGQ